MAGASASLIKPQHEALLASTVIGCLSTLRHNEGRISTNPRSASSGKKGSDPF
jgi:hypothetical protein